MGYYLTLADYFLKPASIQENDFPQLPEAHPSLVDVMPESFVHGHLIRFNANGAALYENGTNNVIGSCLPLDRLCVTITHKNKDYATMMLFRWFTNNITFRPRRPPPPRNIAGQRVYQKVWEQIVDEGYLPADELNGGVWYEPPAQ